MRRREDLPEGCCNKLSTVGQLVDHVGHGLPVHRVQGLVDLVKQVERSRVTFLRGTFRICDDASSLSSLTWIAKIRARATKDFCPPLSWFISLISAFLPVKLMEQETPVAFSSLIAYKHFPRSYPDIQCHPPSYLIIVVSAVITLDGESPSAPGYNFLKHFLEILGNLLEREENCLKLPLL